MPFSELELKLIDKLVGTFCRTRVPVNIQNELRYVYRVKGLDIFLAEDRPRWDKPEEWLAVDFAKLKYVRKHKKWHLYWKRANGRWEQYTPHFESSDLEVLINVIQTDALCCFFG